MIKSFIVLLVLLNSLQVISQTPKSYTSSEILLQLKKLPVLGSVLYVAAHPDDETPDCWPIWPMKNCIVPVI
jgi:hypothetical protein